jgi:hypothetical protein
MIQLWYAVKAVMVVVVGAGMETKTKQRLLGREWWEGDRPSHREVAKVSNG